MSVSERTPPDGESVVGGMIIALGSDHAAFRMKAYLARALVARGYQVADLGTHSEQSCDYPDYAAAVGAAVARGEAALGVLVCGTGIGMSIAANKVPGVRAALVHDPVTARLARQHNDANVLCLGARLMAPEYAEELLFTWLDAAFEPRHLRRLDKIASLESSLPKETL